MRRKLRMGMVGGGGGFIGRVHRMAAALDNEIELVCGVFSSLPERSAEAGAELFLPADRVYSSVEEMFRREAVLAAGERMDFVSIAVPNYLHASIALAALEAGFHVICEKPMATSVADARRMVEAVHRAGRLFCLMHNYSGYPMVKEARSRALAGELGQIRKVVVEYPQGWMAGRFASAGVKNRTWKIDPELAGGSCCVADIGTHAHQLAEYATGLRITDVCADLSCFIDFKSLEDDANMLVRFDNGARGILYASQISTGEANAIRLRVYGSKSGIEWFQEDPNHLVVKWPDRPREILKAGAGNIDLHEATRKACRIPHGHPEGFIEAFANLYREFAGALRRVLEDGASPVEAGGDYPRVEDGLRGLAFIRAALDSHRSDVKWTPVEV
ncbi:MAG: Gfo/Idh/MocA family oxidoreductase [Kiritimatiellaeota bacterium]|nr:Gfo/Idh/MocA family oxidoreductase [Kiritimatiellota bacterium]